MIKIKRIDEFASQMVSEMAVRPDMFKDYEEFDIFDSTYFIVKNKNGLYNLSDRNGNLIGDIWFEKITKNDDGTVETVVKDNGSKSHAATYSNPKEFEACVGVQMDVIYDNILPDDIEIGDIILITPYEIKTDTKSNVVIIAKVVVDGKELLLGKDKKLYNSDGSAYVAKSTPIIISKNKQAGKLTIVDDWSVSRYGNKVTISINIDAFLYPFWERHFELDNTEWKGVEKYKLPSDVELHDLGYITIDFIDDNYIDEISDTCKIYLDVSYPFEQAYMCEYVSRVMQDVFDVEEFGGIELNDMEDIFGHGFEGNKGAEGCWGMIWNNDMFDPVYDEEGDCLGSRNYNIVYGANYEKDYDDLYGTNEVKIIYYISDKELKRPNVDQRQEKFAKKVVNALFGKKYMDELKKRFN